MNDHALTLFTVVKLHQIVLLQWKELTMSFVCHSITLINMVYQNIFFFLLTHGHYTPASFCTDNHRFIIILLFLYKKNRCSMYSENIFCRADRICTLLKWYIKGKVKLYSSIMLQNSCICKETTKPMSSQKIMSHLRLHNFKK